MSKISPFSAPNKAGNVAFPSSRVPRNNASDDGEQETIKLTVEQRFTEMEARMSVLETAILEHAVILRDRLGQRLDRLEEKFRYEADGIRRALQDESKDRHAKIIQLTESFTHAVDRVESRQGSPSDVSATLQDLIAALAATRTHLDGLAQAVADKRDGLAS
ncbi:MAG: hypothetical protein KDN19_04855 [Verrucomicrobiae bacterium]|nr:hypothetical protein [Verrucomicrobiae bacterium]